MIGNFRDIHIGQLIAQRMKECEIMIERAAKFFDVSEDDIERMYTLESLDCNILLRWSKLLKYDFFRIYTQHLILYAPQNNTPKKKETTALPSFRKNIYTPEIIDYVVELVQNGNKSTIQIQKEYNIPTTTVLRWIDKATKRKK